MGGKSSPPPPPDYTPVAEASKESARMARETAIEQLAWAKEQYAMDRQVSDRVVNNFLDTQNSNAEAAARDRARYEQVYQPLENSLVSDAASFSSPERKELEIGRAQGLVSQQFAQQREAARQQLESFGVDPTSTRAQALDLGMRVAQGATAAAAGNQASQMVDATGRALRSEAINVGKGYPGQIAQTYNTALASGTGAVNSQLGTTASGSNSMGTGAQWMGLNNQALNTWGNTLHMGYQDQLAAWKADNDQSSGWGSALGLIGGMASKFIADGGMADNEEATPGGAIPVSASPSGGQAVDDVKAQLTAGEFVFPKDVMQWKGEEWAQKEIQKAREAKQGAVAKPAVGIAPPGPPTFVSRPGGALPLR